MSSSARVIRVIIDPSQARKGAAEARQALASIGQTANGSANAINQASAAMSGMGRNASGASNAMNAANQNFARSNNSILNMARSLGRATIALAGLTAMTGGITGMALALTGAADKASQMEAKLRNATRSQAEFSAASRTVVGIANATRSELGATTDLYTKFAKVSKNAEQATKTFAMALAVSGATSTQAEAAILQFGQALQSGRLGGDEFTSLNENAGRFMDLLADSMGVARGELKALAAEGKITGAVLEKALTDPAMVAKIEAEFGRIPVTFGNVKTAIGNSLIQIAGALKQGLGLDQSLAVMLAQVQQFGERTKPFFTALGAQIRGVFSALAPVVKGVFDIIGPPIMLVVRNMEGIVRWAIAIGAAFLVMKASMGLQSVIAQVVGLGSSMGVTGGVAGFFAGAMTLARNAVNGFTAALLANPFTAIAVGITAVLSLLWQFRDSIKVGAGEFGTLGDVGREVLASIGPLFTAIGNVAKSVFSAIGKFASDNFGWIGRIANDLFGGLDFSLFGFLRLGARVIDLVAGAFIGGFNAIRNVWAALPQAMGAIVAGTANAVISGIESMVNRAIAGINGLIAMANKIPAVNIGQLGAVSMGRVQGPAMPNMAAEMGRGALTGRGGIGAEDAINGFAGRVNDRGRRRQRNGSGAANDNAAASSAAATASSAADAADKASKASQDAAKAMADYWSKLEEARDSAGLVGIELERHNAILEYRKVLGDGDIRRARELTDLERQRIDNLLRETATKKILSDLDQTGRDRARETALLREEALLIGTRSADQVDREMTARKHMRDYEARILQERGDLNDQALKDALAREDATYRENQAIEAGNRLLRDRAKAGEDLILRYAREADPAGFAARDRATRDENIRLRGAGEPKAGYTVQEWQRATTAALKGSATEYDRAMADIAGQWRDRMLGGIDQIADAFGGRLGELIRQFGTAFDAIMRSAQGDHSRSGIFGALSGMFGGEQGNRNAFGQGYDQAARGFTPDALSAAFKDPLASLTSSFNSFQNLFKNGSFAKSLGSVLGAAGQGMSIGGMVGGIGQMISKKFSGAGSQIGGMIGSIFGGPIGSVLGSIGGGLIGGLFGGKKVANGRAGITLDPVTGQLVVSSAGKHGGEADAAAMADKVVSGITSIAQRLGVTFGGNPNVAVGKNGGDWRVSPTGGGTTGKQGITFKTEAEAIAFAIRDLIKDGILVGLSSFSDRLLKSASNLDSAVNLAEQYEKLLKDLGNLKDPVGSSIADLTKNLDRMVEQMKKAGATSDELAKVEEYKSLKMDRLLKDSLSSLYDFRDALNGEGSGVSAFNRLTAAQSEFATMQAAIMNGQSIDQERFTRVGQEIFGLAREVYGTASSQFQAIRQTLLEATNGAINNVTAQFNDSTVVAITQQTDTLVGVGTVTNDLLVQVVTELRRVSGGGDVGLTSNYDQAVNGRYMGAML